MELSQFTFRFHWRRQWPKRAFYSPWFMLIFHLHYSASLWFPHLFILTLILYPLYLSDSPYCTVFHVLKTSLLNWRMHIQSFLYWPTYIWALGIQKELPCPYGINILVKKKKRQLTGKQVNKNYIGYMLRSTLIGGYDGGGDDEILHCWFTSWLQLESPVEVWFVLILLPWSYSE